MTTQRSETSATSTDAAPSVSRQPDGLGKRIGEVAEITVLLDAKPGGAERFRRNAAKIQDDAFHYERLVGTVHDFRVTFINNDTQVVGAVTYDGDFKPYMADIFANAGPWFDEMFEGVVEGYPGSADPGIVDWLAPKIVEADMWYASNPNMTVEDTAKARKVSEAFNSLLDAAAG